MDPVHINVWEIIAHQFKGKAKQQAIALSFPNLSAIKKALQHAKDKLASVFSTDDVLKSEVVFDEEPYHSRPYPPPMHSMYDVDPSWTPGEVATTSYHELRTLPDN
ncbi:hypothetical protein HAX54_005451 [Datura stramonium]|uniref:Uncharacterized protein n=1 Tax=Datura stramonium TaxID=4076 RepID=A0ABS8T8S9_DATST|nr:hypothetical protein [Datura stramonium]